VNPVFAEDGALAQPLGSLLARLHDEQASHIVLAVADDEMVRQEVTAELGERLSGSYRLEEFDFTAAPLPSLPRYYRQLAGDLPVCLFAHGLEALKAHARESGGEEFEQALHYLNAHREDLRLAPGALILWLTSETWKDVQEEAPDFADWESAGVSFVVPPDQRVERTPVGRLSVKEAEDLRRQARGFREMLARPNLGEALASEFRKQLELAERRLGRVADVRRDYRLYLADELSQHVLRGFAPQVGGRVISLPLAKIFLPLRAIEGRPALAEYAEEDLSWQQAAAETSELDWQTRQEEMEKRYARLRERQRIQRTLSLKDLLAERRAVLLGDPGSGKSTVSRYVAWALAAGDLTHVGDAVRDRLPVLVRLAELGKALEADPALTLLDYVASSLLPQPAFGACLRDAIEAGECLVILDGLDEVTDPELRAEVTTRIQTLAGSFGANRFLVTSRIVGYERSPLTQDFKHATLSELEDADRKRFVELWNSAIRAEVPGRDANSTELVGTLETKPQIARMAANPLLLTILVLMHWRGIKLPNRRIQVYQNATDTLIEHWTAERVALDAEEVKQILAPMAHYILSSNVGGVIARRDLLPRLRDGIVAQRGGSPEDAERLCEELLTVLAEQSGIFLERGLDAAGQPVYGFLHQTFGEYLAALHLANHVLEGSFELRDYIHRSAWHEPLLLLAGHLSLFSRRHATGLLRQILEYPYPYEQLLRRNVLLAAECLADDVQVAPQLRDDIASELADLLFHPASQPRQAAMEIYRFLGQTRHREAAAAAVKDRRASWDEPARLASDTARIILALATALVRLRETETAEPLVKQLERNHEEARRLRLEGWPEQAATLLLQWQELEGPFEVGSALSECSLRGIQAEAVQRLLGQEEFCRLLEQILADQDSSSLYRFKLRWLRALASDPPATEHLLSLTAREAPFKIRVLAASCLLSTVHRSPALDTLTEMIPYGVTLAAEALLDADEAERVDWSVVRDFAYETEGPHAADAIRLLLRADRMEVALAATFHLLATWWETPYWQSDPFLPLVESLTTAGQHELSSAIARWLALRPGYSNRFEACEALIASGRVEEAVDFLRWVAYECHGEACQQACSRLLMLREPEPVVPILKQLAETSPSRISGGSAEVQYEASLALALVDGRQESFAESSRIDLETEILDRRHRAYREALGNLYDVGTKVLGEPDAADSELAAMRTLGRLSLDWLCGRGSLREQMASLPDEVADVSLAIGIDLALFEWRGGHLERARQRIARLAGRFRLDSRRVLDRWFVLILGRIYGNQATPILEEALQDPNPRIRTTAVESLGEMMPRGCVHPLIRALADPEAEVRATAALMLGKVHDPEAIGVLMKSLSDEDASVRGAAADALGQLGTLAAVRALTGAFVDDSEVVRLGIVKALSCIGDPTAAETLILALRDADSAVRREAAVGLGTIRHPSAIPALAKAVIEDDHGVRVAALIALGRLGGSQAAHLIIEALSAQDDRVLRVAVESLTRFSGAEVAPQLIQALNDGDEVRQRHIAVVLGRRGELAAVESLARLLASPSGEVRLAAAEALAQLEDPNSARVLSSFIDDDDSRIRAAAIRGLASSADPVARQAILAARKDRSAVVRCAALGALAHLSTSSRTRVLLEALDDPDSSVRYTAVRALRYDQNLAATRGLLSASRDEDSEVRCLSAEALGRSGRDGARGPLLHLLGDEISEVRLAACQSLGRLQPCHEAVAALTALLNDSESGVRAHAALALGRLKATAAYDPLLVCLRDEPTFPRRAAAEALGRLGRPDAIEPLKAAAVQTSLTRTHEAPRHDLPGGHRRALAMTTTALARLNATETVPWLVDSALPDQGYIKALVPLDAESALRVLDRFATHLSGSSWPKQLRGHALWRLDRLQQARSFFRQAAVEGDPNALLALALFDLERSERRSALRHVDQALDKNDRRAVCHLTRAVILYRKGELEEARASLETARRLDPHVTDIQDLQFDHLWRPRALAILEELLALGEYASDSVPYSEVAEPQTPYDAGFDPDRAPTS
jgi:HEAT repeat protein